MKAGDICNRNVVSVSADATIMQAAKAMRDHHVGDVVVVRAADHEKIPIGIVTDRDIVVGVIAREVDALNSIRVGDLVTKELIIVRVDEDIAVVIPTMYSKKIRRVPVVDNTGHLAGILTLDDMIRWHAEQLVDLARLPPRQQDEERHRRA